MTIPEEVVGFLRKNKGNYYCVYCLCDAVNTKSHAMVNTIRATLALCNGFSAKREGCPACLSGHERDLIKAN